MFWATTPTIMGAQTAMKAYRVTQNKRMSSRERGFSRSRDFDKQKIRSCFYLQSLHYWLRDSPFNGVHAKEKKNHFGSLPHPGPYSCSNSEQDQPESMTECVSS